MLELVIHVTVVDDGVVGVIVLVATNQSKQWRPTLADPSDSDVTVCADDDIHASLKRIVC